MSEIPDLMKAGYDPFGRELPKEEQTPAAIAEMAERQFGKLEPHEWKNLQALIQRVRSEEDLTSDWEALCWIQDNVAQAWELLKQVRVAKGGLGAS